MEDVGEMPKRNGVELWEVRLELRAGYDLEIKQIKGESLLNLFYFI